VGLVRFRPLLPLLPGVLLLLRVRLLALGVPLLGVALRGVLLGVALRGVLLGVALRGVLLLRVVLLVLRRRDWLVRVLLPLLLTPLLR